MRREEALLTPVDAPKGGQEVDRASREVHDEMTERGRDGRRLDRRLRSTTTTTSDDMTTGRPSHHHHHHSLNRPLGPRGLEEVVDRP